MRNKCRSSFDIVEVSDEIVFIVDNDIGCSVTNDAENVVELVAQIHPNKRIVYCDTDGCWDELVHTDGVFANFKHYAGEVPY